jgi:hypothetical protein
VSRARFLICALAILWCAQWSRGAGLDSLKTDSLKTDSLNEETLRDKPQKSTTKAVFCSMLVPGLGQVYNESYIKAFAFAATEGILAISASHEHDKMMAFKKSHVFILEKHYRNSRNGLLWWLAGTILLSMGDAYVDAQLYGVDVSPDLSSEQGATARITATYHF